MHSMLIGDLGTPELLIILVVVVLLFGASKLPELARGSGRALRIFKAETKGLLDDDDDSNLKTDDLKTPEQRAIDARRAAEVDDAATVRPAERRDDTTA
jgi:sec-independent protein translocase protein TatA